MNIKSSPRIVFCFPPRGKNEHNLYFRVQQFIDILSPDFPIEILHTLSPTGLSKDRLPLKHRFKKLIRNCPQYFNKIRQSDIVIVYPSPLLICWFVMAKLNHKPVIIDHFTTTPHGASMLSIPRIFKYIFYITDKYIYPRIQTVITHSHKMAAVLREEYPQIPSPVHVLLSVVDHQQFNPEKVTSIQKKQLIKKLEIPKGNFIVIYHGLFHPFHGVDVIVQTAQLANQKKLPITFIFIGRSERQYITRDNMIFIPTLPFAELPLYLSLGHVWLGRFSSLATRERAFSSCMVQAMSMELPIITARGTAYKVITQHKAGKLIAPEDSQKLLQTLLTYKRRPTMRIKHGKSARELVIKKFSLQNYQQELPRIIHTAINE